MWTALNMDWLAKQAAKDEALAAGEKVPHSLSLPLSVPLRSPRCLAHDETLVVLLRED